MGEQNAARDDALGQTWRGTGVFDHAVAEARALRRGSALGDRHEPCRKCHPTFCSRAPELVIRGHGEGRESQRGALQHRLDCARQWPRALRVSAPAVRRITESQNRRKLRGDPTFQHYVDLGKDGFTQSLTFMVTIAETRSAVPSHKTGTSACVGTGFPSSATILKT